MPIRTQIAARAATLSLLLGVAACAASPPTDVAADKTGALDLRLADATLSAGAANTALHVADGILRRNPDDVPALLRRGRALMMLDRPEDAAQSFARAAALQPRSLEALAGLARARDAAGDSKDAEQAWRRALALAPRDVRVRTGLAISLDLQERHADAQALYRSVLAQNPDDAAVRSDLGLSLTLSGHVAEGLPMLRQAAQGGFDGETAGAGARARHNLAVGLALAGDQAGARAVLSRDLPPDEIEAALAGIRQLAAAQ
jgi:Flp pilus assembly protein TadD